MRELLYFCKEYGREEPRVLRTDLTRIGCILVVTTCRSRD